MKLIFVRHGHPNYQEDCLTELGHLQAEAAGRRLLAEKVDRIYASSKGRAQETAAHIAKVRGMDPAEIMTLDFMREVSWGATEGEELYLRGQPWLISPYVVSRGETVTGPEWRENDLYKRNKLLDHCRRVTEGFEAFLQELGYQREGEYYRVTKANDDTVMIVSHNGSSAAVLSHILNLPLPFLFAGVELGLTSITEVALNGEAGDLICPKILLLGDTRHIANISV